MNAKSTPQQKLDHVNHLLQTKQFPQALSAVKAITQQHPKFAPAWATSAILLFQSNDRTGAAAAIKTAKKLDPTNHNHAFQEIMMYESLNRPDIALPLAQTLAKTPLPDNRMNEMLASILSANEDFDAALKLYQHLSSTQPNQSVWLLKSATTLQNQGKIKEAKKLIDTVFISEPDNTDGHYIRSHLTTQTVEHNHIESLRDSCIKSQAPAAKKAKLFYALAKELEDCKQFDDSFIARKTGAELFRQSFQYDLHSDLNFMQQVQKDYDAEFIAHKSAVNLTDRPIFIVGLPRSGTTLLDRIISNHSDVKAAGELKQFNRSMLLELQQLKINPNVSRTEMVSASRQIDFDRLGQTYLQTSAGITGSTGRFTDKFPQNSYYVGMILKALPNAKVIIMQRHPIAVCYSVYKQMFNDDSYPYSYDLKEMAAYYNQHNKLLKHWQAIGGDSVMTVYYEDLVNHLETQAKGIMTFLNLEWQPQCLDFHKNKQATATASASQVREKLYTGSIDMWRNYEEQLTPLIDALNVETKL